MRRIIWSAFTLLVACGGSTADPPTPDVSPPDVTITDAGLILNAIETPIDALLLGAWSDGTDVWIAGGSRGTGGVILRGRDSLRFMSLPAGPNLWWIWGTGEQRWAVGEAGRVLRWAGERWRTESTTLPETAVLWGVWGSGSDDLWAVGGSPRPDGPKGVLLRSTGDGVWHRVQDPAIPSKTNLYKAWGTGPNDIHFVGEAGVALHWDGHGLSRVETGTKALIFTVHGRVNGPILAVGGTSSAIALRWSGDHWVDDEPPDGNAPFNGVFVRPDGSAIVTGQRDLVFERSAAGEWHRIVVPRSDRQNTLHAVWAEDDIWVVGGDFSGGGGGRVLTSRVAPRVEGGVPASLDGSVPDMRLPDMRPPDMAIPDQAIPDVGIPDVAMPDISQPDQGMPVCGDGVVHPSEACDDGNTQVGDGCDAQCEWECGNGQLDPNETCEDGNRIAGDGCDADCQRECGNGQLEGAEECDDGNRDRDDGCDRFCRLECGNGQLNGAETCDDNGREPLDGCDAHCQLECGNGMLEPNEACDDGNTEPGDGCDGACRIEQRPGPGELCPDLVCAETLECWGVADLNFANYCLRPCVDVAECVADFGDDACCQPPGPQLLDTFCLPRALLRDPCGQ